MSQLILRITGTSSTRVGRMMEKDQENDLAEKRPFHSANKFPAVAEDLEDIAFSFCPTNCLIG
jgi:hypothetical protein